MLKVKQVKGSTKVPRRQVETLKCLGLKRIGDEVELKDTPAIRGMINKVIHLVSWTPAK
jgi:large subunit ribosomal protein L30